MRRVHISVAALALSGVLAGCGTGPAAPTSASAGLPYAAATLPGNWQVGAGSMRDASGRNFTVCTLMQTGEGDRRFWIAALPPAVSRDLYIGFRSPDLPAVAGAGRVDRRPLLAIDGIPHRVSKAQQSGTTLSMSIPDAGNKAGDFLTAFARGQALVVSAEDLPGLSATISLRGSAGGAAAWRGCIETELGQAAVTGTAPPPQGQP